MKAEEFYNSQVNKAGELIVPTQVSTRPALYELMEQYAKAQLIKDREKLFREIAQQLWEVNESIYSESEDRNYAIGYDDNGIPNLVSLEIYGRTHSELSFSSPEIE